MSNLLKELCEDRVKLVNEGRAILEKAETEKRNLSEEEKVRYDKIVEDALTKGEEIKRRGQQAKLENEIDTVIEGENRKSHKASKAGEVSGIESDEYRKSLQSYFVRGDRAVGIDEQRALSQGSAPDGGFLVPREQFVNILLKFVDDNVFLRGLATIFQLGKAQSLGYPTLDTDVSDADWTSEVGAVNEDTAMKTGKRELSPNLLSKLAKVSLKLLMNSSVPADTLVLQRLAYKFAVTQEKAFILGTGSGQPLGLMVASALGVPTSRDVSTDNTSTAITIDGLKNAKYSVKGQYWPKAQWMFHRDAVKMISKLKDAEHRYYWEPAVTQGDPDRLLNAPVNMSEYMPNTFTSGLYVGMFGDFSFYHIAEGMNFSVQRLNELYAGNNQVGFIGRQEIDGAPALAEAFARVKLG